MKRRHHNLLKNALSIGALVISLGALQSPLWRPVVAPRCVTAKAGKTVTFEYEYNIEKATILHSRTAGVLASGPRQLMIHGREPGHTCLIIRYKGGESKLFDVVVLPG